MALATAAIISKQLNVLTKQTTTAGCSLLSVRMRLFACDFIFYTRRRDVSLSSGRQRLETSGGIMYTTYN